MPLNLLRIKRTHRYEVASRGFFVVPLHVPQALPLDCTLTINTTGRECLSFVASKLEIQDVSCFGLRYIPTMSSDQDEHKNMRWICLDKPVKKQLDRYAKKQSLYVGVMLYVEKSNILCDERARDLYFSSLKQEVLFGELRGLDLQSSVMLAAYCLQAEYGEWEEGAPQCSAEFLRQYRHLPEALMPATAADYENLVDRLLILYRNLADTCTPRQAQGCYIDLVQSTVGFGLATFACKTSMNGKKSSSMVSATEFGILRDGIIIEWKEAQSSQLRLSWNEIKNFSYRGKQFTVQRIESVGGGALRHKQQLHFAMADEATARYVWQYLVQLHSFYISSWSLKSSHSQQPLPATPPHSLIFHSQPLQQTPDLLHRTSVDANCTVFDLPRNYINYTEATSVESPRSQINYASPSSEAPPCYEAIGVPAGVCSLSLGGSLQDVRLPSYRQVPDYATVMHNREFYEVQRNGVSPKSSACAAEATNEASSYFNASSTHLYDNLPTSTPTVTSIVPRPPDVTIEAQQQHSQHLAPSHTISVPDIHSLMQRLNGKDTQFAASLLQDFSRNQALVSSMVPILSTRHNLVHAATPAHRSTPNLYAKDMYSDYVNAEILLDALRPMSASSVDSSATFHVFSETTGTGMLTSMTSTMGECPYDDVNASFNASMPLMEKLKSYHSSSDCDSCSSGSNGEYDLQHGDSLRTNLTSRRLPIPLPKTPSAITAPANGSTSGNVKQRSELTVSLANLLWAESERVAFSDVQLLPRDERRQALEARLAAGNLMKEFCAIPMRDTSKDCLVGGSIENQGRNRHFNDQFLPYDESRVKLKPTQENLSGYINASHVRVRVRGREVNHIAAQTPLLDTRREFWQMVWQLHVQVVADLSSQQGDDVNEIYWPRHIGPQYALAFDDELTVELRQFCDNTTAAGYVTACIWLQHSRVALGREVWLLTYRSWTNASDDVPLQRSSFLCFLDEVDSLNRHFGPAAATEPHSANVEASSTHVLTVAQEGSLTSQNIKSEPPVLFHCESGVGRTGVAISLQVMKICLEHNQDLSVPTILCTLRGYRACLVRTLAQYTFLYHSLILYLRNNRLI